MLAFILRRLGQSVVVMLVVAVLSFLMFRYVGVLISMVGQEASIADQEALQDRLGLNDPFYVQFFALTPFRASSFLSPKSR